MTAWIIIIVAVLASYLVVDHFFGSLAIPYLVLVCWLLWRNRFQLTLFASNLQRKVDAFDEAEIPHKKLKKTSFLKKKKSRKPSFVKTKPISLPGMSSTAPRPEKPVLRGAFLKKTLGKLENADVPLPMWFRNSSKTAADLWRLTPKEFSTYLVSNGLNVMDSETVAEFLKSQEQYEALTGDIFFNNWKQLEKSGKIAELDKAAPRLSEEWLRLLYPLLPKSIRKLLTEEEFVLARDYVEDGINLEELRFQAYLSYTLSSFDSEQRQRDKERREKEWQAKMAREEKSRAWEQQRDALRDLRDKEALDVLQRASELRQQGRDLDAVELENDHFRKWNDIL